MKAALQVLGKLRPGFAAAPRRNGCCQWSSFVGQRAQKQEADGGAGSFFLLRLCVPLNTCNWQGLTESQPAKQRVLCRVAAAALRNRVWRESLELKTINSLRTLQPSAWLIDKPKAWK